MRARIACLGVWVLIGIGGQAAAQALAQSNAQVPDAVARSGASISPDVVTPDGGRYFGSIVNGKLHGKGRLEWRNGARYEGQFADGLMEGDGKLVFASGDEYVGEFRNGMLDGLGRKQMKDGSVYAGDFKRDLYHGRGQLEHANGDVYQGEFINGKYEGRGALVFKDGRRYRGEFAEGRFHGEGRFEAPNGDVYEGEFDKGEFTGKGTYTQASGGRHEGVFRGWRAFGFGTFYDREGNVFEGNFINNELTGQGRMRGRAGFVYQGEFRAWRFHGEGVLKLANGDEYTGGFVNGQYEGRGTLKYARPREDGRLADSGMWRDGRFEEAKARELALSNVETALYNQRALLDRALSGLAPREPGKSNLYFLAVAGDGSIEVFRREVEFVRAQFEREFGAAGRAVSLVNSRSSVSAAPLATTTSVREAIQAIAARMNRDEDILFLYLTSHGLPERELVLAQNALGMKNLAAPALGSMLRESGIRWKVLVISSCYSGGFIEHLKDDTTLVITASRHDRTSFGCTDDSEFTYFGRAFFKEALPGAGSFQEAFRKAEGMVREWELRDAKEQGRPNSPDFSFPQMHDAGPISDHLRRWWPRRGSP